MTTPATYRWRKVTDINRENALFELMDSDVPLLDVGFTNEGIFEVAFYSGMSGRVLEWKQLFKLLNEGKTLADRDR